MNRLAARIRGTLTGSIVAVILIVVSARASAAPETAAALQLVADPRPFLEELQRRMATLRSVSLEFTQERHLQLFNEPLVSEGVMLIEGPDQIRWETLKPYQSILLGNHQGVAQFERADGTWKKLRLGFPQLLRRVMEQMVLMHQGKLDALTRDFGITVATGAVVVVTMVPKDKTVRSMLAALEVHLQPDFSATREVVMKEPSGEFTRILFQHERRGVRLPGGTFDQVKPLEIDAIRKALRDGD